jgi:hypothetical protein
MAVTFEAVFTWDGDVLAGLANHAGARIRCRAGRDTIARLPGFAHATGLQIGLEKANAFGLMKDAFTRKIERGRFDADEMKSVTLLVEDLWS